MPTSSLAKLAAASTAALVALTATTGRAAEPSPFAKFDAPAKELLGRMTLDEKVGQMIQPEQGDLKDPGDIDKYHLGSLLSGGGSGPKDPKKYNLQGWADLVDGYQSRAVTTRLGIPLVYGVDAVHGHNNVPGATIFPHNVGLGCTRDPALVEQIERVTAEEVRATGINWVFAPCITVPQDERWGRTYEGFGEGPQLAAELGAAAVRGFQGKSLDDPLSVLACAKHFAGDGGTAYGSNTTHGKPFGMDQGDTRVDDATLRKIHLHPYPAAIAAGVGTVMPSYSSINGVKCSGNEHLLTGLLKGEMGFGGFLISDYNALDQLGPDFKADVATSINAGMDMVMLTGRYPELFADLKELATDGKIPMKRIDDAVLRILRVKFAMGLMEKKRSVLADRSLFASFGSAEHRAVARKAVRQSLVLLKNERGVLPLKKAGKLFVAGKGADSLGIQCGGWTRDWQGKADSDLPGGTTILAGLKAAMTNVTYAADGTGAAGHDAAVVVVGEKPYAEFFGDSSDLTLDAADAALVAKVKSSGVPTVVVVLSGRPLVLGKVLDEADAVVAAWLPGSEGAGVADVLGGEAKFTGKLSRTWPRSMDQVAMTHVNTEGAKYDPAFKFGFGLTYGEKHAGR